MCSCCSKHIPIRMTLKVTHLSSKLSACHLSKTVCSIHQGRDKKTENASANARAFSDIVEVSSDEEGCLQCSATQSPPRSTAKPQVQLLVDDRERLRDADPRGLLDRVIAATSGLGTVVKRQRLHLGDFAWVIGEAHAREEACTLLGCAVERKRLSDLVGRSASGIHVRQIERLEASGLPHPFLLLEGESSYASTCAVYDVDPCAPEASPDVIQSAEDIYDLAAYLFITGSRVGFISTRDFQTTARTLGLLTSWLEWKVSGDKAFIAGDVCLAQTMHEFKEAAALQTLARNELAMKLQTAGLNATIIGVLCHRFCSIDAVSAAVMSCDLPEHRPYFFDFSLACTKSGRHICAALGIPTLPCKDEEPVFQRTVHISATPALLRRLGKPPASAGIVVQEMTNIPTESLSNICAEFVVRATASQDPTVKDIQCRCSKKYLIVIIPGLSLLEEVLAASETLGSAAPIVEIAAKTSASLSARLPCLACAQRRSCLVILEGLRTAVVSTARAGSRVMPPFVLGIMELAALLLDLDHGWRVRVHEAKPEASTVRFIQTLVQVALREATLPFIQKKV